MRLQPLCIIVICAWTALSGAGCTGLIVTHHKGTTAGPGNVVSLFSVARRDGKPLGRLTESNFEIYERNKLVPASLTRQKLVSANRVVDHYTLLLLDLGLCDLKEASLQAVIDATGAFVDRRSKRSKVGIFGFDGGESINQLSDFTNDAQALKSALAALKQTKERDPSTDINGSMIKALEALKAAWNLSPSTPVANPMSARVAAGGTYVTSIRLPAADRCSTVDRVASIASSLRYMVTPSHTQIVGTSARWPHASRRSPSASCSKSTLTK